MKFTSILKKALLAVTVGTFLSTTAIASITAPTDVAGNVLWLDASDFTVNGTSVATWTDKSGAGNHATASGLGSQPTVNTTGLNGMPTVHFEIGQGLKIADSLALTRDYTVFIVDQYNGANRARSLQSRDTNVNWLVGKWNGGNSHYANGWVTSTNANTAPDQTPVLGEAVGGSTYSKYFIDGNNVTSGPGVGNTPGQPGRLGLGSEGFFQGFDSGQFDASSIVIYDRILTLKEQEDVGTFIAEKWGLTHNYVTDTSAWQDHGTVTQFTGADPGEGLDLQGNLIYKVNVGGPNIVDANGNWKTETHQNGISVTANNHITSWIGPPNLGATASDDALEAALTSIRWSAPNNPIPTVNVTMDVIPGHTYKLQALFTENIQNLPDHQRVFTPSVNGVHQESLVVDINNVAPSNAGPPTAGAVYTYEFTASSTTATLDLSSTHIGIDHNPILNAFTLEDLTDTVGNPNQHSGISSAGNFSGGDLGEGLDLEGDFLYAINVGGLDTTVRGLTFTNDTSTPGASVLAGAHIPSWVAHEYGVTPDDDAIESIMQSIRYSPNGLVDISLDGLLLGETYKLQLLFDEGCCDRGADIFIEGELAIDDLATGFPNDGVGTVFTHEFTAIDTTLNIQLSGLQTSFADKAPLLQAVTLEVIPEPTSLGLLAIGMLVAVRRRKA